LNLSRTKHILLVILCLLVFGVSLVLQQKLGYALHLYATFNGVISDPNSITNNFIFTPFGIFTYVSSGAIAFSIYEFVINYKNGIYRFDKIYLVIFAVGLIISVIDAILWEFISRLSKYFNHTFYILSRFAVMAIAILPTAMIFFWYIRKKSDEDELNNLLDTAQHAKDNPDYFFVIYNQNFLLAEKLHLQSLDENIVREAFTKYQFTDLSDAIEFAETMISEFIDLNLIDGIPFDEQPLYEQLTYGDYRGPLPVVLGRGQEIYFTEQQAYLQLTAHFDEERHVQHYFPEFNFFIQYDNSEQVLKFVSINYLTKKYQILFFLNRIFSKELESKIFTRLAAMEGTSPISVIREVLLENEYVEDRVWDFYLESGPGELTTIFNYQIHTS